MIELLEGLYSEDGGGISPTPKKKYGIDVDTFLGETGSNGMLQLPLTQSNLDFTGVKSIGSQVLMYRFLNTNVTSVDFSDLEALDAASACEGAFYACTLTSVDFPKLTSIKGSKALKLAFGKNLHLSSIRFRVLDDLGTRTDQFDDMLEGVTGCTVHFPEDMESTMQNWTSVTNGFGGTNTTVLFDEGILPTYLFSINTSAENTVTINGVEQTSASVKEGSTVTWSVSRTGYTTQSGSQVITQDITLDITLVIEQYTFTITPSPVDATVMINNVEQSSLTADYGTSISWEVNKTGYVAQSGTYTLTEDYTLSVTLVEESQEEELDWILLTGTQYLDNIEHEIPINSTMESKINIDSGTLIESIAYIFNGVSSDDNTFRKSLSFQPRRRYLNYGLYTNTTESKSLTTADYALTGGSDITVKYENFKIYQNGIQLNTSTSTASAQYDKVCNGYAIISNYDKTRLFNATKFYWLKIYDGNTSTVIHNYVPILDANNEVKIKDLVTNEVYSFNGTNIEDITYGRKS